MMEEESDVDAVKEKVYEAMSKIGQKRNMYQEMCSTVYSKILKEEDQALKSTKIVDYKSTITTVPHKNPLDSPIADSKQKSYCVDSLKNDIGSLKKDNQSVSKIIDIHQKEVQVRKAREEAYGGSSEEFTRGSAS